MEQAATVADAGDSPPGPRALPPLDEVDIEAADPKGADLLEHIKSEGRAGLVSFMNNAFHTKISGGQVTFYFDRSHANLIPMVRNPKYLSHLDELAKSFLGSESQIHFAVGNDPKIAARRRRQEEALEKVKANPVVKFIMEEFNSKIINCEILGEEKE